MRKASWPFIFFIGLLLCCSFGPSTYADSDDPRKLAEFLVLQNTQSRKALSSVSYTFRAEYVDLVKGGPPALHTGTVKQAGPYRWTSETWVTQNTTRASKISDTITSVLGPHTFAFYPKGNDMAEEYSFESLEQSDSAKKAARGFSAPDMLDYGFGNGWFGMRELYDRYSRQVYEWRGSETTVEDRKLYLLQLFPKTGRNVGKAVLTLQLDPQKGFLVTKSFLVGAAATIEETEVKPKRFSGGQWFPETIIRHRFTDKPQPTPEDNVRISLSDVVISEPPPAGAFTLDSLAIPDSVRLARIASDGTITISRKVNGVWQPAPAAESNRIVGEVAPPVRLESQSPAHPATYSWNWYLLGSGFAISALILCSVFLYWERGRRGASKTR